MFVQGKEKRNPGKIQETTKDEIRLEQLERKKERTPLIETKEPHKLAQEMAKSRQSTKRCADPCCTNME